MHFLSLIFFYQTATKSTVFVKIERLNLHEKQNNGRAAVIWKTNRI